jgi:hypothetical protein
MPKDAMVFAANPTMLSARPHYHHDHLQSDDDHHLGFFYYN